MFLSLHKIQAANIKIALIVWYRILGAPSVSNMHAKVTVN